MYQQNIYCNIEIVFRIENLDAKGNDLVEMPKDIWKMSGLHRVDVSDNLLTGILSDLVNMIAGACLY